MSRLSDATAYYNRGLERVATTPYPEGQKFAPGTRVRIADDLGMFMSRFPAGVMATVCHTYAHAYGGNDIESYSLDVDGHGNISWYNVNQLTAA